MSAIARLLDLVQDQRPAMTIAARAEYCNLLGKFPPARSEVSRHYLVRWPDGRALDEDEYYGGSPDKFENFWVERWEATTLSFVEAHKIAGEARGRGCSGAIAVCVVVYRVARKARPS